MSWARLLTKPAEVVLDGERRPEARKPGDGLHKRLFEIGIERCRCGGTLKIIAAIGHSPIIAKILTHVGLPARARPTPRRGYSILRGPSRANL